MKILFVLFGIFLLMSCKAQPQYYQQKVSSHKEIAKIYFQEGRYAEALKELELAKETDKCDAETFNLLGLVYMARKEFVKAEEAFNEALKLDPNFSEAYTNLGSLRMMQGKYREALSYFERALSNPLYLNSYITLTNIGWAYYQLGDKEKALMYLQKALNERARFSKALIYMALIYLNEGDLSSSEFYLKRVLKADRSNLEARYYLGEVFFRQGRLDLAKEIWESILSISPESEWGTLAEQKIYLIEKLKANNS
ncbi:MAG: tetratricopeptide repeat protein [Caldimicrobium sp.]